jgi:hypothetical protein
MRNTIEEKELACYHCGSKESEGLEVWEWTTEFDPPEEDASEYGITCYDCYLSA